MTPDFLEQRLAGLTVDVPDAGRITARVLSPAAMPRRRHLARVAALAVATLALMLAVLYFVPAADAVLADAPIAGDLLRDAGLVGAGNRVTAVGAVSTSSGYRVELVGAYADSTRTVLLLHSKPAIWLSVVQPELKDQFGRTYPFRSARGNALTGNVVLQFEALGWPDAITGARITLHMTMVEPVTCSASPSRNATDVICNPGQPVVGSWTLPATLGVDEGTTLAVPAPAHLGPGTYRVTSVRSTAATIAVDIEVTGVTAADLARRIPDGGKGQAVFTIELFGPTGERVTSSVGTSDNEHGVHLSLLGYRFTPGDYHVHMTHLGSGEFDLVLHVP